MLPLFILLLGLSVGSFLNVVIWRVHQGRSFLKGRSQCLRCGHPLPWYDNIPLVSFILLKGKCRYCQKKISWQYPLVELATALLFSLVFLLKFSHSNFGGNNFQFSIYNFQSIFNFIIFNLNLLDILFLTYWLVILSFLIIIFVYDLKWSLIPDIISVPVIIFIFFFNLFMTQIGWSGSVLPSFISSLGGGIIGLSFFAVQFLISKGKWVGSGDLRLGALIGLILGWPKILLALLSAYWIGSLIALLLIISSKKKWQDQIPLGPFLVSATLVVMFWGEEIMNSFSIFNF